MLPPIPKTVHVHNEPACSRCVPVSIVSCTPNQDDGSEGSLSKSSAKDIPAEDEDNDYDDVHVEDNAGSTGSDTTAQEYEEDDDVNSTINHPPSIGNTAATSDPSFAHSINYVPIEHSLLIKEALQFYWNIHTPQDFQVVTINEGAFNDNSITYLICKTGSGKSAVPLTIATICRGITIVLVPLLGLGSNQVMKASREEKGI